VFLKKGNIEMSGYGLARSARIFAVACLVVFVFLNDAWGVDWVLYETDALGNYTFYDRDSVQYVSSSLVKVWTTKVFSDDGRADLLKSTAKEHLPSAWIVSLSEIKHLWYLSCTDKKYKITQVNYYATDGSILSATHNDDNQWNDANQKVKILMNELCIKPEDKKR
jgi:hypothetical protein